MLYEVITSDDIFFPLDSCFQEHITNNSPDSVLHYAEKLIHYYSKQDDKIKQLELFDSTCNYLLRITSYNVCYTKLLRAPLGLKNPYYINCTLN